MASSSCSESRYRRRARPAFRCQVGLSCQWLRPEFVGRLGGVSCVSIRFKRSNPTLPAWQAGPRTIDQRWCRCNRKPSAPRSLCRPRTMVPAAEQRRIPETCPTVRQKMPQAARGAMPIWRTLAVGERPEPGFPWEPPPPRESPAGRDKLPVLDHGGQTGRLDTSWGWSWQKIC